MAFLQKVGSIVKRSAGSGSSLLQAVRAMSSSKVFVGGISYGTDEQSLGDAFANYGQVVEAKVITDRETGRSRGFGFVTYTSAEEAGAAITGMDGKDLQGRVVRVSYAHDRGTRAGGYGAPQGGGYNDGGNYGAPQGGQGGYGGNTGYTGGGGGGYNAAPGNYGGDSLNQGGGAPAAAAFGGGNYGASNASADLSTGKLDDLLSDLKFDDAGKEDGDAVKSGGQEDMLEVDFKDEDVADEDYANKRS
ncbi:unnamed protein product [Alopecurus aequalis]